MTTSKETTMKTTTELHAVFATDGEHKTFRVSDPLSWNDAQNEWTKLDDQRRAGLLPQAKFFEVRAVTLGPDRPLVGPEVRSHDRYDRAELNMQMTRPVSSTRGFADVEDAAHRAWMELTDGEYTVRKRSWSGELTEYKGQQGLGGWFYYPNGQTAAQGKRDLVRVATARRLVVRGANGRWYPVAQVTL